jgi:subtilase family serine protease
MIPRKTLIFLLLLGSLLAGHGLVPAGSGKIGAAPVIVSSAATGPDLAVGLKSTEPDWPRNNVKITVTVKNIGDAPAPKADCLVIIRQGHAPRQVIRTIKKTIRTLGAGDRYEFTFVVKVGLGIFEAAATVDRRNKIAETDETNNFAKIPIVGE